MFSIELREYPKKVNLAILSLCAAWLLHYVFYFLYLFDRTAGLANVDYLQLGVGIGICVFVAGIKRWARMMCVFFNLGMIGLYAFVTYAFFSSGQNKEATVLTAALVILFSLATVLLLGREVGAFFKERDPLPERAKPEDLVIEKLPPRKDGKSKKK